MSIVKIVEIFGSVVGLFYIYYQYKASSKLWIVGILMSLAYIFVFTKTLCYFWAATYLYYLLAAIYGLVLWRKNDTPTKNQYDGITRCPRKYFLPLFLIFSILSVVIAYFAKAMLDSPIPIGEAISTALSVVAMWLLAKKYLEHWLLWIVVNLFYAVLNFTLELYPTALMFTVYLVVAILGYFKWKKEIIMIN